MPGITNRKRIFNTEHPCVVLKPLRWGGKTYRQGDKFPWRQLAISQRKLAQMWEQRKVDFRAPAKKGSTPAKASAKKVAAPAKAPAESGDGRE